MNLKSQFCLYFETEGVSDLREKESFGKVVNKWVWICNSNLRGNTIVFEFQIEEPKVWIIWLLDVWH